MIKTIQQRTEWNLNEIKSIYKKAQLASYLTMKQPVFSLSKGKGLWSLHSLLLINIVLTALGSGLWNDGEERKGRQAGNLEELKWVLFTDNMLVYLGNHIKYTEQLLNLVSKFSKIWDTMSTYKNQLSTCTLATNVWQK